MSTDPTPADKTGKFLFERSFDDERRRGNDPKAVLSAGELEAIKAQARAEGINEGKNEANENQQAQLNVLLGKLSGDLQNLAQYSDTQQKTRDEALATAIKAIAQKLMPHYVQANGLGEIEGIVTKTLNDLRGEPRLVIRVAEAHVEACSQRLPEIAKQIAFPGQLIILGEPNLTASDCRIEWADGGLERLENNLWTEIEMVLAKYAPHTGVSTRAAKVQEYEQKTTDVTPSHEGGINVSE